MTATPYSNDNAVEVDSSALIELLWARWAALLDRFDGRDTATTDPVERVQIHLELQARAMLLCSIPAPSHAALGYKVILAAWLQIYAADSWTTRMVEAAITADTQALQPADDLSA